VFPVLPGSAETKVTRGGIVKHLLIAYFIGNISAKNYQNPFTHVKVIASQMWDVFLRHGVALTVVSILDFSRSDTLIYTVRLVDRDADIADHR